MKNIRNLAEERFRITIERERQIRLWSLGHPLGREWSEDMIREQQAISDSIERGRKDEATHWQSSSSPSQPTLDTSDSYTSGRPAKGATWTPRSIPELWVPSTAPEADAHMSRSIARPGSTTEYWAPVVLSRGRVSTASHDAMKRERDRKLTIEQERNRARDREKTLSDSDIHTEAQVNVTSTPQRLDERHQPPLSSSMTPSTSSTVPVVYSRSLKGSRPYVPTPSASRPIDAKQTPVISTRGWMSSNPPRKTCRALAVTFRPKGTIRAMFIHITKYPRASMMMKESIALREKRKGLLGAR